MDALEQEELGPSPSALALGRHVIRIGWIVAAVGLIATALVGPMFGARGLQSGTGLFLFTATRVTVLIGMLIAAVGYRWRQLNALFQTVAGASDSTLKHIPSSLVYRRRRTIWAGLTMGFVALPLLLLVTNPNGFLGGMSLVVLFFQTPVVMLQLARSKRRPWQNFGIGGLIVCFAAVMLFAGFILRITMQPMMGPGYLESVRILIMYWGLCLFGGAFALCAGEALAPWEDPDRR